MPSRVILIGPGGIGAWIARGLASCAEVGELLLVARHDAIPAALLNVCGTARVRFIELDVRRQGDVERLLQRARPDLIVQCAVEVSPWDVREQRGGFALQLPFQLPLLRNVMEAVRTVGFRGPVVNASYPDVTHPILATRGLAPTIGVGNVGMIELQVRAALRARGVEGEPVRVIAHHAHVTPMVNATPIEPRPRVFLGEEGIRADELAFAGPLLPNDRRLTELSAASALPLLRALLGGPPVRISTPAPMGLPGGWPVRVSENGIALDLPPGTDREEVIAFQWESARRDGVDHIDDEGRVYFVDGETAPHFAFS